MLHTFRLKSEVPSCWGELESPGEQAIETLPSLVRKCADDVTVSILFVIMVIRIQHNNFQFPKISGKLSACANSGYQALSFPGHREPGYEAKYPPTADTGILWH